jgi:hypothetical protein
LRQTAAACAARALQSALAGGATETDFFPRVSDLPEGLSGAEFKKRFGDVNSKAYASILQLIDARIGAIALYQ